ncbi:Gfo/Idh/MocA family protein [Thalassotalea sp. PLHSN55]|uniref:Gfo/Idh/MocA family protein n=1 Tax=Thalassotalea sp. PLHSN55 TaxID=3435888 RepID=UPI003F82B298
MDNSSKVRWGIVGTGRIAEQFCQDLPFVSNAELAAVAARKRVDAQRFANKYDIEYAYQSYQSMFESSKVDAVYIATPHTFHYCNIKSALEAGKSVLCEKPITVSSREFDELSKLAQTKGLFLMEAMWTYFLPAIKKAKAWVDQGKIGDIKHIKADFGYPLPYDSNRREYHKDLGGGCLLEMGIYPLALAHHFTKEPMSNMQISYHLAPNGVEDDVIILAQSGNTKLTLATSFQCKLQNWAYIIGEHGYIAIPDFWRASQCSLFQLDEKVDFFCDQRTTLGFNFEADAAGEAIMANSVEHATMPHSASLLLQQQMEKLKRQFK